MKPKHLSLLSLVLFFLSFFSVFILSQKYSPIERNGFSPILQVNAQSTQLETAIANLPGTNSTYILLSNGQHIEKDAETQRHAMSVIKIWIAAAVFAASEKNQIDLSQTHTVTAQDVVGGTTFVTQGSTYTLSQLVEYMLLYSDNIASNILINKLGGFNAVNEYITSNGYTKTKLQRFLGQAQATTLSSSNITSAKDVAIFMQNLMGKKVVSQSASDALIAILGRRSQLKKDFIFIGRDIPGQAGFIGKSGIYPDARNDAGTFLNKNGERVFLAVLVDDLQDGKIAEDGIAKIASLLYDSSSSSSTGGFAECKFTKGDQNPKDLPYQSPLLLSYFQEVANKTGVPATVLAGIARVESTTDSYTISNYSDDDIRAMEQAAQTNSNLEGTIPNSTKALCPKSPTGARGVMQIQPPGTTGHAPDAITNGARFLGKTVSDLTVQDYCNPKTSIYLAAGFVLKKMQGLGYGDGTKWDPTWNTDKKYFDAAASSYYGCLKYPSCQNGPNSYGDDLWASFQSCKADAAPIPQIPGGALSMESNEVVTRVGNPPTESIIADASCPVPNGEITCASYGPQESWGGFHGTCAVDNAGNGGHCSNVYISRVGICKDREVGGNLIRTAKSIDITAKGGNRAGDPVYLPSINGKALTWYYKGVQSAGPGFGSMRLFQSEPTPEGVWSIHFVHANTDNPPLAIDQPVKSGEVGATMYNLGDGIHIHVTVGLNVGDSVNNLQNHSPGWKFADRELGMCTK